MTVRVFSINNMPLNRKKKTSFICYYRLLLCRQAKGMTSSSGDFPLSVPPSSPPLLQPCTTHRDKNKHTTGSIQQLAGYLYGQKREKKYKSTEKTPVSVPFSMQAWSYLRSTKSEMHSLLLVFSVLVATMVTILNLQEWAAFLGFQQNAPEKRRNERKTTSN